MPTLADTANVVSTLPGTVDINDVVYRIDRQRTRSYGSIVLARITDGQLAVLTLVPGMRDQYHLRALDSTRAALSHPLRRVRPDGTLGRSVRVMWVGDMVAEIDRRVPAEPRMRKNA